ncbi:MAG: LPS-assembly protein LptD [Bdellovibrionales bacterium]
MLLNADSMVRDTKKQMIFLKGNVQLVFKNQHIRANQATVNVKTKTIEATGDLSLISPLSKAIGTHGTFNYETNKGIVYNAYVEKGAQIQFTGEVIEKIGDDEYIVRSGEFTACNTCPASWKFRGSSIRATMGDYAHIWNPVMYISGVPIFWLPYLMVPINTQRKSGLLFPQLYYGNQSRFVYSQSFFWAMSDSTDSTWTFENYQGRGPKGHLNYRYMLTDRSLGELDTSFLRDKGFATPDELSDRQGQHIPRYLFKYRHYYDLPNNYVQRTQINYVTDTKYPRDFPGDIRGHGDPALVSKASLTKNSDNHHVSIEASHHKNLLAADPLSGDSESVHRYPSIKYTFAPQKVVGDMLFEMEGRYTNFARSSGNFDKLNVNPVTGRRATPPTVNKNATNPQVFDPNTDLIRAGQRAEFEPRLSYPLHAGRYLDLLPSISYLESNYQFGITDQPSASRRYVRGTISGRTQFATILGDRENPKATRYKHEVQPELVYTNIPWLDQPPHPFFGENEPFFKREQALSNSDFPQFDDYDRLYDRHITTFNLTNIFTRRTGNEESSNYYRLANFTLSQPYDNYEASREHKEGEALEPYGPLYGILDLRLGYLESNSTARYYHYDNITAFSSRVRYNFGRNFLQINTAHEFQIKKTLYQPNATSYPFRYATHSDVLNYSQNVTPAIGYKSKYFQVAGGLNFSTTSGRLTNFNYVIDIIPPGDCWGFTWFEDHPINDSGSETKYGFAFTINYGSGARTMNSSSFDRYRN